MDPNSLCFECRIDPLRILSCEYDDIISICKIEKIPINDHKINIMKYLLFIYFGGKK